MMRRTLRGERWPWRGVSKAELLNDVDKGGHFAAWEEPQLFAIERRAAFRSLR